MWSEIIERLSLGRDSNSEFYNITGGYNRENRVKGDKTYNCIRLVTEDEKK